MKKNSRSSAKANTASSAGSLTLDVKTPFISSKANGNGSKPNKNGNGNEFADEIDNHELLRILLEVKEGNFSVRMPGDKIGIGGKICDTLNGIILLNEALVEELTKARKTIGLKGHLNHRVELPRFAKGSWASGVDSINSLISDLVHPTIEIARVISSVAKGNLSQEMPLKIGAHVLQGEFAKIAAEVNDMVKQLNLFSMEVTRVAREVGSEGKLGGQAKVKGVAGVWKDLTDSVNQQQLFYNLFSNAIKFRKRSEDLVINVMATKMDSNELSKYTKYSTTKNFHKITVEDNGIGFDDKYAEDIFRVFKRLHSYNDFEGTGVGLSICKKIIEKHNGFIRAESKIDNGSTFIIGLPEMNVVNQY